jgi:molybdopterin biosynthesis enzyme MoaB
MSMEMTNKLTPLNISVLTVSDTRNEKNDTFIDRRPFPD